MRFRWSPCRSGGRRRSLVLRRGRVGWAWWWSRLLGLCRGVGLVFFLLPDLLLCVGESARLGYGSSFSQIWRFGVKPWIRVGAVRWSGGGSLARRRVMCALLASPVELDMELFPVRECGSEGFCVVAVAAALFVCDTRLCFLVGRL